MKTFLALLLITGSVFGASIGIVKDSVTDECDQLVKFTNPSNTYSVVEVDPVWAAVSNTVTTGAALGATAYQSGEAIDYSWITNQPSMFTPTDWETDYVTDYADYTNTKATAESAVQSIPANDETTTNMTQAVTMASNLTVSGTISASNLNDAYSPSYAITAIDGTATVSRSYSGVYYNSFTLLSTGTTVLAIDTSTFPTNGDSAFSWTINPAGHTISVDSSSIDTNTWDNITLTTNAYNKLIFERAPYETIFYVWGRP